jgi:hypothetical protein
LQIAQLDGQKAARRGAELIAILETASAKIDRFGWNQMDKHLKDSLSADWCDVLNIYTLAEVRAAVRAVFEESKGKLRSINEYQVQEQIKLAHRKLLATLPPKAPEPPKKPLTPEELEQRRIRAAKIMAAAGLPKTAEKDTKTAEKSQ